MMADLNRLLQQLLKHFHQEVWSMVHVESMAEVANILMTWQLKRAQSDLKESKKRQKLCRGTLLQNERTMRTRRIKEKKKGLVP